MPHLCWQKRIIIVIYFEQRQSKPIIMTSSSGSSPRSQQPLPVHLHPALDGSLLDRPPLSSRVPAYTSKYLHHPQWKQMSELEKIPQPESTNTVSGYGCG